VRGLHASAHVHIDHLQRSYF